MKLRIALSLGTLAVVALTLAIGWRALHGPVASDPEAVYSRHFERQVWPLLTRGGDDSCVGCHDQENKSPLHFLPDARSSFKLLLDLDYFAPGNPDSLLGRITSTNAKKRMPKGKSAAPWSAVDIEGLQAFQRNLNRAWSRPKGDERFPAALLASYTGPVPDALDNQFISYRQLKGKIQTIFRDDWNRNGRDLFQENISLLGGADFKERFNETTKASATFLSAMEWLSRDVAARAYALKSGPFRGWPERAPLESETQQLNPPLEKQIRQLYQRILFRSPIAEEMQTSFALLRDVYRSKEEIQSGNYELAFRLFVSDESTGLSATNSISIPVSGDRRSLYQEWIDQSQSHSRRLGGTFRFKAKDPGQLFRIHNRNSVGNVSFAGIELEALNLSGAAPPGIRIQAHDPIVQAEGAWRLNGSGENARYDDESNDKGQSSITVPISVPAEGEYALTVFWRADPNNTPNVLVEVVSHDRDQLAGSSLPPMPPPGEAHYWIDQSEDRVAFAELGAVFQFGPDDYVEINNRNTRNRVTADAVKFISGQGKVFLIDNDEAQGNEQWKPYDSGTFRAYNQTGKNTYHDENRRKGELALRFLPSLKSELWDSEAFYQVKVGYPAKRDHETRTPVIVKARRSSPIVQLSYPLRARADGSIEIDASASYTIQQSPLKFSWEQISGPHVLENNPSGPRLKFVVPRRQVEAAAWEGLTQALLRHPDFLFTRPPSVASVNDPQEKRTLQLVKIALDLAGRPPTDAELEELGRGTGFGAMIDRYLESQEFKDFYFHRIRLYLESQGTELQDEPARLWCYVAFNDRPFQEILTADYTVDAQMQRQPRPEYHGKTGMLTTRGFIEGKLGLPHFNYAAQVAELFLGYVFEVPPEIVEQREGITAVATTDPNSLCYSCHKLLTPLAYQRTCWDDEGRFRTHDEYGLPIDDSDQQLVATYPFPGAGMEAFALQAVKKERFVRTIINTHFTFFFGREMRYLLEERFLYKKLWDEVHRSGFSIRRLIKAILTSPEYLEGRPVMLDTRSSQPATGS